MPDVAMPDLEDLHKCPMGTGSQVSRPFFHAAPTTFAAMSCSRSLPGVALPAASLDLPNPFRQPEA